MSGENKNLRDSVKDTKNIPAPYEAGGFHSGSLSLPYTKINKLVTALYMVTDTMEKDEPVRLKLRTLGIEILSDITVSKAGFDIKKVDQILSFLNIASDVRMISEMNFNILRKEFEELKQSMQEFTTKNNFWFEELTKDSPSLKSVSFSKGHGTRIGVQKGSTLLKALNKIEIKDNNFEILKNKRREEIIAIIKDKKNTKGVDGITITDIKNEAKDTLVSCGEKTLQRELISMVKDNVLKKTGEKRWSQYFLN